MRSLFTGAPHGIPSNWTDEKQPQDDMLRGPDPFLCGRRWYVQAR